MKHWLNELQVKWIILKLRIIAFPTVIKQKMVNIFYRGNAPETIKQHQRAEHLAVVYESIDAKTLDYVNLIEKEKLLLQLYNCIPSPESKIAGCVIKIFSGQIPNAEDISISAHLFKYKYPLLAFRDALLAENTLTQAQFNYWNVANHQRLFAILFWRPSTYKNKITFDNTPEGFSEEDLKVEEI